MASAQELLIVLDATTARLRREMQRADQSVNDASRRIDRSLERSDAAFHRFGESARSASEAVTKALGVMGIALGAAEIVKGVGDTLDHLQEIKRSAEGLGISIKSVQELSYTFKQFNVDSDDVTESLAQFSGQALGAIQGSESLIDTWGQLGITVDQLRGKKPDQLFRLLAQGIAQTHDPIVRLAASNSLLGEDLAGMLLPALIRGKEGIVAMGDAADEAGAIMEDKLVDGGDKAATAISKLKTQLDTAFTRAVAENADALAAATTELAETLTDPSVITGLTELTKLSANFLSNMTAGFITLSRSIGRVQEAQTLGGKLEAAGTGIANNSFFGRL